jgi:hypothetical protein
MRSLFVTIALLALVGCAGVPKQVAAPASTQVEPLSEVVVFECHKFLGAVVILPDGSLEALDDEAAAHAVYNALADGHAAVVNAGEDCAPKQST